MRGSEILGKTIVAADTGERLGKVEDLVFDEQRQAMVGLRLRRSWRRRARVLPFAAVEAIGPDAIVAREHTALATSSEVPEIRRMGTNEVLKGKRVLTSDGRQLGHLVDIRFDDASGHIEGYELSTGVLGALTRRHRFLPAPDTMMLGKDFAIVPPEAATLLDSANGRHANVAADDAGWEHGSR